MSDEHVHVTEGVNNTVHVAFISSSGGIAGTLCNREPFTINFKDRKFYRSEHSVTCKRCLKQL